MEKMQEQKIKILSEENSELRKLSEEISSRLEE